MAIAKVSGSDYTTPPNTKGSGSNNDGGAAARISTNTVLDGVGVSRYNTGVFASTVVDNNSADKAISGGVFRHEHVKPITKRVTTELAGVSSSVLQSTAGQPGLIRSIHKLETLRTRRLTTAIRAGYWNIYTGAFTTPPTVAVDSLATDHAATPTRSVPGELTFMTGAANPVNNDYKAKTG